jgi:glycine/D-amino acid oxidase-like deaminating enzyme
MIETIAWPPSLWVAVTSPGAAHSPLQGSISADVAIVGAGFTGLSAALHLARAGIQVAVIEAKAPGWGASGRNNGQVIPTLSKVDPDAIEARHGAAGERFVALLRDSARLLFDLAREEGVACEAEQTGWIQPAHTPGRMRLAEKRVAQWTRRGAPVALLSREEVARRLGSEAWHGGWTNATGGHINPLALARGLADAVIRRGGRVFAQSPALAFGRTAQGWRVSTATGEVTARALVIATNAYTGEIAPGLAPDMAREIVPVLSWQMATTPLGEDVRRTVLPGREAVSDTRGELFFMRYDARHRLVTGGAMVSSINGAERLKALVAARFKRLVPAVGEVRFDYVWNGYIAMTRDYLPRLHRLGPDAYAWAGCNGRAVGLAVALGREFARAIQGARESDLALPFTPADPIPFHGVARRLAPLVLWEYKRRDRTEI